MKLLAMIAAIIVWAGTFIDATELSTDVYPSEDELREALHLGLIDEDRLTILLDILREGIDSTNAHLFEEIPGLTGATPDSARDNLQAEQAAPFRTEQVRDRTYAELSHRYYQEMERDGRGHYRTTVRVAPRDDLEGSFRLERSLSGRERITGRRVQLHRTEGMIREVVVGSFSRRLGLGTVAGYRGRLLDCENRLDGESVLFPDYGGFNGAGVYLAHGNWDARGVASVRRDDRYRMTMLAAEIRRDFERVDVGLVAGRTEIQRRDDDRYVTGHKIGAQAAWRHGGGRVRAEAVAQTGYRSGFGAAVADGYWRNNSLRLYYRGWHYAERYLDLSGGSVAGPISTRDSIPEIAFGFRTRRAGASGGSVRAAVPLSRVWEIEQSALVSTFGADTIRLEYLGVVSLAVHEGVTLRLDYLTRLTRKRTTSADPDDIRRRLRGEVRWRGDAVSGRVYAAYTRETGEPDRLSLFGRVTAHIEKVGTAELWSNLGRINTQSRQIDYWYTYIRLGFSLSDVLGPAIKIAHRFSRSYSDRHTTTVIMEIRGIW